MSAVVGTRSRARWGVGTAVLVVATMGALAAPAQADPNVTQTVSGTVVGDVSGQGVPYVYVQVLNASNQVVGGANGDANGHYILMEPGSATYTLQFSSFFFPGMGGGYQSATTQVTIDSADVSVPNVAMVQSLNCSTKTKVTGSLTVGQTLTAGTGTVTPAGVDQDVTYAWSRVGYDDSGVDSELYTTPLPGVTGSTYTLTAADQGAQIAVSTTVSSPTRGTTYCPPLTTRTIGARLPVTAPAPTAAPAVPDAKTPTITGHRAGKLLKASASAPGASATYQWLRNGRAIAGATSATYRSTKASTGKRISVVVTYTRAGYTPVVLTSKSTKVTK